MNWIVTEVMSPLRYIRTMLLRCSSQSEAVSDESIWLHWLSGALSLSGPGGSPGANGGVSRYQVASRPSAAACRRSINFTVHDCSVRAAAEKAKKACRNRRGRSSAARSRYRPSLIYRGRGDRDGWRRAFFELHRRARFAPQIRQRSPNRQVVRRQFARPFEVRDRRRDPPHPGRHVSEIVQHLGAVAAGLARLAQHPERRRVVLARRQQRAHPAERHHVERVKRERLLEVRHRVSRRPLAPQSLGGFGQPRRLYGKAPPAGLDFDPLGADFSLEDSDPWAEVFAQPLDYHVVVAAAGFEKNKAECVADMIFAPDDDTHRGATRAHRESPFSLGSV